MPFLRSPSELSLVYCMLPQFTKFTSSLRVLTMQPDHHGDAVTAAEACADWLADADGSTGAIDDVRHALSERFGKSLVDACWGQVRQPIGEL